MSHDSPGEADGCGDCAVETRDPKKNAAIATPIATTAIPSTKRTRGRNLIDCNWLAIPNIQSLMTLTQALRPALVCLRHHRTIKIFRQCEEVMQKGYRYPAIQLPEAGTIV